MTAMREESGERLSAGLSDKVSRHEFDALTAMVQDMRSQRHMAAAVLATCGHTTMPPRDDWMRPICEPRPADATPRQPTRHSETWPRDSHGT